MNEQIMQTLRLHVDETVLHMPACATRVEQIREELFAHLLAIYEDELTRTSNETSALRAALRRFGGGENMRDDLASCVPILERTFFSLWARKEHFMWRVFMIVGVLAGLIGMAFVCPAAAQILQTGDSGWVHVSLLLFGSVVTFAGIASFAVGVQRLRAGTS